MLHPYRNQSIETSGFYINVTLGGKFELIPHIDLELVIDWSIYEMQHWSEMI